MSNIIFNDANSIVVIKPNGELKRLLCPFLVRLSNSKGKFAVLKVTEGKQVKLYYFIGNAYQPYNKFVIIS